MGLKQRDMKREIRKTYREFERSGFLLQGEKKKKKIFQQNFALQKPVQYFVLIPKNKNKYQTIEAVDSVSDPFSSHVTKVVMKVCN